MISILVNYLKMLRKGSGIAAVSCSAVGYRGWIGVWADGQAGLCMGQCMGGAWLSGCAWFGQMHD